MWIRVAGAAVGALVLSSCTQAPEPLSVLVPDAAAAAVAAVAQQSPREVEVTAGGMNGLVRQAGTPGSADVLITSDQEAMRTAQQAGVVVGEPVTVARSRLTMVVPEDRAGAIRGLQQFENGDHALVLCAEPIPCGRAARRAFDRQKVQPSVSGYESSPQQALALVADGEADATFVWEVDAAGEPGVIASKVAKKMPSTRYQAAVLAGASDSAAALQFLTDLVSPEGQQVLSSFGFRQGG